MSYRAYKRHIRALLTEYGRKGILTGTTPVKFFPPENIDAQEGGMILARNPGLLFRDDARLKLYEKIQIVDNDVQLLEYSYHYERPGGYFFRYEREPTTDSVRKPEYHCHVILNLPHFIAPPVSLKTILEIIAANFYAPDVYHKQIIGQDIRLTV